MEVYIDLPKVTQPGKGRKYVPMLFMTLLYIEVGNVEQYLRRVYHPK